MISLAIIGLGAWGETLVRSVQGKSNKVQFTMIVSRSPDRLQSVAKELGVCVAPTLEHVLSDASLDGIVLATPHSLHADQIRSCVAAGKPVFVEKPFTLNHASALSALADVPADQIVAAGHNRRFLPSVIALKSAIDRGDLGQILHIECNFSGNVASKYNVDQWRVAPKESPAGGMAGAGIHMLDLMIHLVAPIREVFAMSRRQVLTVPMDDTTYAMFTLEGGAGAVLSTIMASVPTFRAQVFGTKGAAELRGSESLEFTMLDGKIDHLKFPPTDIERAELEAFADAISGVAPYPISRPDILNGVAAFEAVGVSAAEERKVLLA